MNPIQIIFFDIDGTLVDMQTKRIPAKTLEALVRLKAKGIKLCIATGRSPISVPTFAGVDFDAFLTFNGAYCYDRFGPIYRNPIQPEAVAKILQKAGCRGHWGSAGSQWFGCGSGGLFFLCKSQTDCRPGFRCSVSGRNLPNYAGLPCIRLSCHSGGGNRR